MNKTRILFLLLFALLLAARLCHVEILWAEETLPLAAAQQMRAGKVLYRDIWFDKPPVAPVLYRALGGEPGWCCARRAPSTRCSAAGSHSRSRAICGASGKAVGRRGCSASS